MVQGTNVFTYNFFLKNAKLKWRKLVLKTHQRCVRKQMLYHLQRYMHKYANFNH